VIHELIVSYFVVLMITGAVIFAAGLLVGLKLARHLPERSESDHRAMTPQ
jgi:hypothetical protein